MGDAYKSLTIRIGANSVGFTQAMKGMQAGVRATQKDLRKLNAASKLDPQNIELANSRIKAMRATAKASAVQVGMLNAQLAKAAKEKGGWDQLRKDMKDVSLNAGVVKGKFNAVNAELEQAYNHIAEVANKSKGIDFEKARAGVKAALGDTRKLEQVIAGIFNGTKYKMLFDATNAKEYAAAIEKLRGEYKKLQVQKEELEHDEALKNVAIDAQKATAEMKDLVRQAVRAEAELRQMGANKGIVRLTEEIRGLKECADSANARFRELDNALRMNPGSLETAKARMLALVEEANVLKAAIAEARSKMLAMDSSRIEAIESKFVSTANAVRVYGERLTWAEQKAALLETQLSKMRSDDAMPVERIKKAEIALAKVRKEAEDVRHEFNRMNDAHSAKEAANEARMLEARLEGVQAKMMGARRSWAQFGSTVRTFGYSMLATVGSGAMMAGMYSIQAAKDIDSAYRNMRKTVNGTEEQFESLKQAALEFSQTHFTSADQILEIEAIGGQLGIQAQNLEKFSEVVSNTDIATNLDVETIAQNFGQLSNIMNDMDQDIQSGPGSLEAYSDALVRLGNNSAAQEDKIQNVMMRIASMGTISGMTTPDLLALATATAATGQGAEAAGTAISKTFSNIESAVNGGQKAIDALKNTSGMADEEIEKLQKQAEKAMEKMDSFGKVAGMSGQEFQKAWNKTPMDAFKAFIEGLKEIDKSGGSVDGTLKELGITSVRQKQTLMGLTQTVDILNNCLLMSNDAWNGVSDVWGDAGDAAREAQRKAEGFSGQLEILVNNGKVLAEELTDSLTPAVSALGGLVKDLASGFAGLPDPIKNTVSVLGLLTAAAPFAAIAIGSVIDGVASLTSVFGKGASSSKTIAKAIAELERAGYEITGITRKAGEAEKAISGFKGKFLGVAAAIAGVATVAYLAYGKYRELNEWAEKVGKSHQTMAERMVDGMGRARDATDKLASAQSKTYQDYMNGVEEYAKGYYERYKSFVEKCAAENDKLAQQSRETFQSTDLVDYYKEQALPLMEKLESGGKLTRKEFGKLSSSISGLASATGENLKVIEDADGNIKVLKDSADLASDALGNLADSFVTAAMKSLMTEEYKNAVNTMLEAQKNLSDNTKFSSVSEAKKYLKAAEDKWVAAQAQADAAKGMASEEGGQYWASLQAEADKAKSEYDQIRESVEGYTKAVEDSEKAIKQSQEALALLNREAKEGSVAAMVKENYQALKVFASGTKSFDDFEAALEFAGLSAKDFANVDIGAVANEWNGEISTLDNLLDKYGIKLDEVKRDLKDGDKTVQKSAHELLNFDRIKVGKKSYWLDDNGTLWDQEGKIKKFDTIKVGNKEYWVTNKGTLWSEEGKLKGFKRIQIGKKYYAVSDDGTLYYEGEKVEEFSRKKVNGKYYFVRNDGSLEIEEDGLKRLDEFTLKGKTLYIDDKGNFYDTKQEIEELDGFELKGTVDIDGDGKVELEEIQQQFYEWNQTKLEGKKSFIEIEDDQFVDSQSRVYEWNGTALVDKEGHAIVEDTMLIDSLDRVWIWNGEELKPLEGQVNVEYGPQLEGAEQKIENVNSAIDTINGNTITPEAKADAIDSLIEKSANAYDTLMELQTPVSTNVTYDSLTGAEGMAQSLQNKLVEITSNPWNVHVNISKTGEIDSASGGYFPKAVAHASGYFVDRPTVIGHTGNVTHIAGEAGREYVQRFANGGFGVMPLTNPKMRPWTTDIAKQISGMGGNTYNITLQYNAGADANRMARDLMREIRNTIG